MGDIVRRDTNKFRKISNELSDVLRNNYDTEPIDTLDFLEFIEIIQKWCECNLRILKMREDIQNSICHDCIHDYTDSTGAWLCEYGMICSNGCIKFERKTEE